MGTKPLASRHARHQDFAEGGNGALKFEPKIKSVPQTEAMAVSLCDFSEKIAILTLFGSLIHVFRV